MKNFSSFIKCLDNVLNQRLQVYGELRRYVSWDSLFLRGTDTSKVFIHLISCLAWCLRFLSARCKYYFDCMLSQRGYSGSMSFDHKKETLSISVSSPDLLNVSSTNTRSRISCTKQNSGPFFCRCTQARKTRLTWATCVPCLEASAPSPLFALFCLFGRSQRRLSAALMSLMFTW